MCVGLADGLFFRRLHGRPCNCGGACVHAKARLERRCPRRVGVCSDALRKKKRCDKQLCSSMPIGANYFWSHRLGGKNGPLWSWLTGACFSCFCFAKKKKSHPLYCRLGYANLLGQVSVTAAVTMAAAQAVVVLGVSKFSHHCFISPPFFPTSPRVSRLTRALAVCSLPSLLNRHGGLSLQSFSPPHALLATAVPALEPCPVDFYDKIVTSTRARLSAADGLAYYLPASGLFGPVLDAGGVVTHTSLAYDDAMCVKQPWNPSQPVVYAILPCYPADERVHQLCVHRDRELAAPRVHLCARGRQLGDHHRPADCGEQPPGRSDGVDALPTGQLGRGLWARCGPRQQCQHIHGLCCQRQGQRRRQRQCERGFYSRVALTH